MVLKLPEFPPFSTNFRTPQGNRLQANKWTNSGLRRLSTYQNLQAKPSCSLGEKPAASAGKNHAIYPKMGGTRAIKANPRQLKLEKGNFELFLTKKTEQFTPTKQEQPAVKRKSRADPDFPAGGEEFWVPNQVLEQEKKAKNQAFSPVSPGMAGFSFFFFGWLQREEEEQNREWLGRKERRKKKKKRSHPYPNPFTFKSLSFQNIHIKPQNNLFSQSSP
ncbi:hypothetical protein SLE2022_171030 [Rubroshorea leprosula]